MRLALLRPVMACSAAAPLMVRCPAWVRPVVACSAAVPPTVTCLMVVACPRGVRATAACRRVTGTARRRVAPRLCRRDGSHRMRASRMHACLGLLLSLPAPGTVSRPSSRSGAGGLRAGQRRRCRSRSGWRCWSCVGWLPGGRQAGWPDLGGLGEWWRWCRSRSWRRCWSSAGRASVGEPAARPPRRQGARGPSVDGATGKPQEPPKEKRSWWRIRGRWSVRRPCSLHRARDRGRDRLGVRQGSPLPLPQARARGRERWGVRSAGRPQQGQGHPAANRRSPTREARWQPAAPAKRSTHPRYAPEAADHPPQPWAWHTHPATPATAPPPHAEDGTPPQAHPRNSP